MNSIVARLFLLVLPTAAMFAVQPSILAGQRARVAREPEAAMQRQIVTGRVCMPDGSSAVGAVVVTSAGGSASTGPDGSFRLEIELPLDTRSLEVTAVANERAGSGSLVARASVVPSALSRTTSVGLLALTLSTECHPRWLPTFGSLPGLDGGPVRALVVHDDGSGPALYAGGSFTSAGPVTVNRIAKWDGRHWSALGSGVNIDVNALAVWDDGGGPALYAGGWFTTAGGVPAAHIAKWDGASWSALCDGLDAPVNSLAVFDDGSGSALYAGGSFANAGVVAAARIAKWDGASWSALGAGVNQTVRALAVFDCAGKPELYAGGLFTTAGGVAASSIAKWDGASWSAVGTGVSFTPNPPATTVTAMVVYDDGGGPKLHAAGLFTTAGGVAANDIASWDGSSWSALGSGIAHTIAYLTFIGSLAVYDDGNGPALFAGGGFITSDGARNLVKWNGSSWEEVGGPHEATVYALTVYDDGTGAALMAEDAHTRSGWTIAGWRGSSWSMLGSGLDDSVTAWAVYDDGSGPALYAGGYFSKAGGGEASYVAKWDGARWSQLAGGLGNSVLALIVHDDGSGPALYAGGTFVDPVPAGGVNARHIARWNGTTWSAVGFGTNSTVMAMTIYDDGAGPQLYAGGDFTGPGNRVAKWNGSSWEKLRNGTNGKVNAMTVYDDGSGPALYVGGDFTSADGVAANRIARWDGASWSALGSGMNDWVESLAVFDDCDGPSLCAGGRFLTAGGVSSPHIARWNGLGWSEVGGGLVEEVVALSVHDDGSGPALYAGGRYRIVEWNGSSWTTVAAMGQRVNAFTTWDDGAGPALYAGGEFRSSPAGDSFVAKWGCKAKETVKRRKL